MRTLQIEESKARSIYKTASPELKIMLEDTFGKEFFIENIMDKVKCYAEANNIYYNNVEAQFRSTVPMYVYPKFKNKIVYYAQAILIAEVLNEGWKLDYEKISRSRYDLYAVKCYIAYNMDKKSFSVQHSRENLYGIPLMFKSEELAQYFIDTFPEICNALYK